VKDKGIEKFMHKIGTSYTKYFNKKNKRSGALFQGSFKAAHIDSNEHLLYLAAYVNKNNFIHRYNKNDDWEYTSLHSYLEKREDKFICKDIISRQFNDVQECEKFFNENALYMREKKEDERYLIED
jgi:putative transposase